MASIHYDGEKVGIGVEKVRSIAEDLNSYSNNLYNATKIIVSANGFDQFVGGITANTFSDAIQNFSSGVNDLIHKIREEQIQVLQFSKNKDDINVFLKSLTDEESKQYDLEQIERLKDRSSNIFKRAGSTLATIGLGLVEGVGDFLETGADLLVMAGCGVASIFTAGFDFLTGKKNENSVTKRMWDWCRGYVADKKVETCFNKFYSNTNIGRQIKANAYGFDTVRSISKGVGYTAGMIGLTVLTGGLAAGGGAAVGAAGTVSSTNLAITAGVLGFSNGTEEAWADGADLLDGFKYGLASGAWEGIQWYAGAKINQVGGIGDQVAKTFFNGAKGAATRVALDTVDSAAEGFVQPALKMIYKYDDKKSFSENYKQQFEESGGWDNVKTQAILGGTMSFASEVGDLRKLLKENKNTNVLEGEIVGGTAVAGGGAAIAMDNSKISSIGKTTASINGKTIDVDILPTNAKLDTSNMKVIDAEVVNTKTLGSNVSAKNVDVNLKNMDTKISAKNVDVSIKNVDAKVTKNVDVNLKNTVTKNVDSTIKNANVGVVTKQIIDAEYSPKNTIQYTKTVNSALPVVKNTTSNVPVAKTATSNLPTVKNTASNLPVVKTTTSNLPAVKNVSSNLPTIKNVTSDSYVMKTGSTVSTTAASAFVKSDAPVIHTKESVKATVRDGIEQSITSGAFDNLDSQVLSGGLNGVANSAKNTNNNQSNDTVQKIMNKAKAIKPQKTMIDTSAAGNKITEITSRISKNTTSQADSAINSKSLSTLGTVSAASTMIPAVNLKTVGSNIDSSVTKQISSNLSNTKSSMMRNIGSNADVGVKNVNVDISLKNIDSNLSTKNIDANLKNVDPKNIKADVTIKNKDTKVDLGFDTAVKSNKDVSIKVESSYKSLGGTLLEDVNSTEGMNSTVASNIEKAKSSKAASSVWNEYKNKDVGEVLTDSFDKNNKYYGKFTEEDLKTFYKDHKVPENYKSTILGYDYSNAKKDFLSSYDGEGPFAKKFTSQDLKYYKETGKLPESFHYAAADYMLEDPISKDLIDSQWDGKYYGKFTKEQVDNYTKYGEIPKNYESIVKETEYKSEVSKNLLGAQFKGDKFYGKFTDAELDTYYKDGIVPKNYDKVAAEVKSSKINTNSLESQFKEYTPKKNEIKTDIASEYKDNNISKKYDTDLEKFYKNDSPVKKVNVEQKSPLESLFKDDVPSKNLNEKEVLGVAPTIDKSPFKEISVGPDGTKANNIFEKIPIEKKTSSVFETKGPDPSVEFKGGGFSDTVPSSSKVFKSF
ncbi:MAG: hypothetical protein IJ193_07585, partial [Bacilli bacterium]|nr:hypothetical protein [Bacilli bacterium]